MLNKILELSLNFRLLILMGAAGVTLIGVLAISTMEVDVLPDLTAPTVTVLTECHGLEAEEVERLVSLQIERGLNGSPNVRRLRSASALGISIVWVEFDWGTPIFRARQIVSERLSTIADLLPHGVGEPTMAPISSIMGEILIVGITSDSLSPMELRTLADWEIRPRLRSIQGVANVFTMGGEYQQFQVLASPLKMAHYGVSLKELEHAVADANVNSSGGFYNQYGNQYLIKGEGRVQTVDEIASSLVKTVHHRPIRIGDVAEVRIGPADKIGDGSFNTEPAVILTITKQPETNTLALTKDIDHTFAELKTTLPSSVKINSEIFRQADFIQSSIDNLQKTLLEGAFFVVIVLFLFLMNWRTTLISLLAIPLSLIVSFIVLRWLGYTINTMSLGGMAIAIGALVDDAIIDVENVFKRLRENHLRDPEKRLPVLQVIYQGSSEIRNSILIATLIIIVSFVPLFFLGGMEGRLLRPLGISFITSVLSSLVIAITLTPVLCSYFLDRGKLLARTASGTVVEKFLRRGYQSILAFLLRLLDFRKISCTGTCHVSVNNIWLGIRGRRTFPVPPWS